MLTAPVGFRKTNRFATGNTKEQTLCQWSLRRLKRRQPTTASANTPPPPPNATEHTTHSNLPMIPQPNVSFRLPSSGQSATPVVDQYGQASKIHFPQQSAWMGLACLNIHPTNFYPSADIHAFKNIPTPR